MGGGKTQQFQSTVRVRRWLFGFPVVGAPVSLVFVSGAFGPVPTDGSGNAVITHTATGTARVFVNGVERLTFTAPGTVTVTIGWWW